MENNNKLIAEFLGMTTHHNDKNILILNTKDGNDIISVDDLKYHTDWNWLMQVIDKIEKEYRFSILISWQHCVIESNSCEFRIEKDSDTKLKATYNAVVEFIKWYNEQ